MCFKADSMLQILTCLALFIIMICPCQKNNNYLGILELTLKQGQEQKKKVNTNFFLGNGIKEKDPKEAAAKLLNRDHKDVANLNENYFNGKLGAKFLPPIYFSDIPHIINPDDYETKKNFKPAMVDKIRAEKAEKTMFQALQKHFNETKDDVLVLSSHKFSNDTSVKEKDFIILNLSKGYVMNLEVKVDSKKFKSAKPQLYDGKNRLDEIFSEIGLSSGWKFIGVFYAQTGEKLFDCPKDKCSTYAIIGEDQIEEKLKQIEKHIAIENKTWEPSEHVNEFSELFKELVFIAQGNPYAPVTDSAITKQTSKDIDKAGTFENIWFWTPDQLSIADAVEMDFVFLNSFYSTGKTTLLKHRAKYLDEKLKKKNKNVGRVFYIINKYENDKRKLPFTLITEYEFQKLNVIVREAIVIFCQVASVEAFIFENGLTKHDHICFDEVICMNSNSDSKIFSDGMKKLKNHVSSLWIAMGGSFFPNSVDLLSKYGFVCPKLQYPLRNPLEIVNHVQKFMQVPNAAHKGSLLWHKVDVGDTSNMTIGQLHVIPNLFLTLNGALKVNLFIHSGYFYYIDGYKK